MKSEVNPIAAKWKELGLSLGLGSSSLDTIEAGKKTDPASCLYDVLNAWLKKNYDVKNCGEPTWKHLVEAVRDPAGGADNSLAEKIAKKHKSRSM